MSPVRTCVESHHSRHISCSVIGFLVFICCSHSTYQRSVSTHRLTFNGSHSKTNKATIGWHNPKYTSLCRNYLHWCETTHLLIKRLNTLKCQMSNCQPKNDIILANKETRYTILANQGAIQYWPTRSSTILTNQGTTILTNKGNIQFWPSKELYNCCIVPLSGVARGDFSWLRINVALPEQPPQSVQARVFNFPYKYIKILTSAGIESMTHNMDNSYPMNSLLLSKN